MVPSHNTSFSPPYLPAVFPSNVPTQTRINREKYTFCVIKSLKFKNWPRQLFRPRTDHACHHKPNPSRETVPHIDYRSLLFIFSFNLLLSRLWKTLLFSSFLKQSIFYAAASESTVKSNWLTSNFQCVQEDFMVYDPYYLALSFYPVNSLLHTIYV